jgi:hypothetical protein
LFLALATVAIACSVGLAADSPTAGQRGEFTDSKGNRLTYDWGHVPSSTFTAVTFAPNAAGSSQAEMRVELVGSTRGFVRLQFFSPEGVKQGNERPADLSGFKQIRFKTASWDASTAAVTSYSGNARPMRLAVSIPSAVDGGKDKSYVIPVVVPVPRDWTEFAIPLAPLPGFPADYFRKVPCIEFAIANTCGDLDGGVRLAGLAFATSAPSREEVLARHLKLGPGLKLVTGNEVPVTLSQRDGQAGLNFMGKGNFSLSFAVDGKAAGVAGAEDVFVILDYFDEYRHWDSNLVEVAWGQSKATFWRYGSQKPGLEPWKLSRWRTRAVPLKGVKQHGNMSLTFRCPILLKGARLAPMDRLQREQLAKWEGYCQMISRQQLCRIVQRARCEDVLVQGLRAAHYREAELPVPLDEDRAALLRVFIAQEGRIDGHYHRGPLLIAENNWRDYQALVADIEGADACLRLQIVDVKEKADHCLRELQARVDGRRFAWYRAGDVPRFPRAKAGASGVVNPFQAEIVFHCFGNTYWPGEFLEAHTRENYSVAKMLGVNALFNIMGCWVEKDGTFHSNLDPGRGWIEWNERYGFRTTPATGLIHMGLCGPTPAWLEEKFHSDPEFRAIGAKGQRADPHPSMVTGNIYHPGYREYVATVMEKAGQAWKGRTDFPGVCISSESEFMVWRKDGPVPAGYGKLARRAFQEHLRKKHGSLDRLNRLWGSAYTEFSQIELPAEDASTTRKPCALIYEHERFRQQSFADHVAFVNACYKKGDPNHPTWLSPYGTFDASVGHAWNLADLMGCADIVNSHYMTVPVAAAHNYMGPRYHGTLFADAEYVTNGPEGCAPNSSEVVKAASQRGFWLWMSWGCRGFDLWNRGFFAAGEESYYGNFHDTHLILPVREAEATVTAIDRARRFGDLLRETRLSETGVGVLCPTASLILDPLSNRSPNWAVKTEGEVLYDWLYKNNYPAFIVPEEYVINGKENLDRFRLLVAPLCTYLPLELVEKLLAWVGQGGTLILDGPAGLYNQYARPDNRLLTTLFATDVQAECVTSEGHGAGLELEDLPGGLPIPWQGMRTGDKAGRPLANIKGWRFGVTFKEVTPSVRVLLCFTGGKIGLAEARYGKGRALLSSFGLGNNSFKDFVIQQAQAGYPDPPLTSSVSDTIGYVMRESADGTKFVCLLNHDSAKPVKTTLSVKGTFDKVNDLGIEGGFPVPATTRKGRTEFTINLSPGDGTCLSLAPPGE